MSRVYPIPDHIMHGEIVLRDKRVYLRKPGVEIDITAVYWFFKEMFTTEWDNQPKQEGGGE